MKELKRLAYTIGNGNKPNENDVKALNGVIEYFNNERKRDLQNNELFAKLFINVFKNDLIKSNGDYQKTLNTLKMIFKIDIHAHYDSLHSEINQIEFDNLCAYLDISAGISLIEEEKNDKIIKDNSETLSKVLNKFTKDKVYERLNRLINQILEDNV